MKSLCWMGMVFLCCIFTGCNPTGNVTTLSDGYEKVTYVHHSIIAEPDLVEIKLQYHDPKGKQVVVWTFLESEVFQKDGVAVFLAQKYYLWDGLDKRWGEEARVFAVKAPELPIDISTEIAGRWAQKSGKDVKAALTYLHDNGIMNGKVNGDNLDFYMNGSDMIVSWDEISDMMRVVKENGAVHKDPELGTKCWEMEFRPVVQK